jgi:MoaA/NifB/PqqE/SkfB family radical SAM enzyme
MRSLGISNTEAASWPAMVGLGVELCLGINTLYFFHERAWNRIIIDSIRYNSTDLVRPTELTERERFLLEDSKTFCIYPWIHLHAYPTGEAYPCCHAEMKPGVVGNCRTNTLAEIWQDGTHADSYVQTC